MASTRSTLMQQAGDLLQRLQGMELPRQQEAAVVAVDGCDAQLPAGISDWQRCGLREVVVGSYATASGLTFELTFCSCHRDRLQRSGVSKVTLVKVEEVQR